MSGWESRRNFSQVFICLLGYLHGTMSLPWLYARCGYEKSDLFGLTSRNLFFLTLLDNDNVLDSQSQWEILDHQSLTRREMMKWNRSFIIWQRKRLLIGKFIEYFYFFFFCRVDWIRDRRMFRKWLLFYVFWLNSKVEKIVVHFEDLRQNIPQELRRIMRFINMTHSDEIGKCVLKHPGTPRIHLATVDNPYKRFNKTFINNTQTFYKNIKELLNKASYRWIVYFMSIIHHFFSRINSLFYI